ncbi:GGDEF domain-containing protein [Maricurvus nonylphenolicus]|uniref:GGDEF domain-containing protein n=1 Tax=Maricurvus nonylphenolicus TaxID=1008307 RepID=UPI0036F199D9
MSEEVSVIDQFGNFLYVNHAWRCFSQGNDGASSWADANYLTACERASANGDDLAAVAAQGIRSVINDQQDEFYLEYPCHSSAEQRWFMMRVTAFAHGGQHCFVITHKNITERKLAEEAVLELSRIDGLTDIANRRCFDEFLESEYRRCARLSMPLSLAIIDLDHFKLLNDTYGHQAGDECLSKIAKLLKGFAKRPCDLCARYGGEEFVIVLGNTSLIQAEAIMTRMLEAIRALSIPNAHSPVEDFLTVSVGLSTIYPSKDSNEHQLIEAADTQLYVAKNGGRNQLASAQYLIMD